MKKKNYISLNILNYINIFVLSINISVKGLEFVNPFWLISPYLFLLINILIFNKYDLRKVYYKYLILVLKFVLLIYAYFIGRYDVLIFPELVFFIILFIFSIILMYFENILYVEKKEQLIHFDDFDIDFINRHEKLNIKLKTLGIISFRLQVHIFFLIIGYALIIESNILILSTQTLYLGIVTLILAVLIIIYILFKFLQYFLELKKNVKYSILSVISAILPIPLSFIFASFLENNFFAIVLAIFAIPCWIVYKKEINRLWTEFKEMYKNINE